MVSPMGGPPGSRVTRNGMPDCSKRLASRFTWVDFPQPSVPSKVMNGRRDMRRECLNNYRPLSNLALERGSGLSAAILPSPFRVSQSSRVLAMASRHRELYERNLWTGLTGFTEFRGGLPIPD